MGVIIQNVTEHSKPTGIHDYVLRINAEEICRFQHLRESGLAECLRCAADAVDIARKGKP